MNTKKFYHLFFEGLLFLYALSSLYDYIFRFNELGNIHKIFIPLGIVSFIITQLPHQRFFIKSQLLEIIIGILVGTSLLVWLILLKMPLSV